LLALIADIPAVHNPPQRTGPSMSDSEWFGRWMAVCVAVTTSGTAAVGFALYAFVAYADPCDAYCSPGDPWTPGSWHQDVQMWRLATPALVIASVLIWPVAAARIKTSIALVIGLTGLLTGWCVFTGVIHSHDSKHYLWWIGLLVAAVGGAASTAISALSRKPTRST
jgi:hypothetical protein